MGNYCGQCRHYQRGRYNEASCGLTQKPVGFLWTMDCYEGIELNINKLTLNTNKMETNATTRVCKTCGRELPIDNYKKFGRGYLSECNECREKANQETEELEEIPTYGTIASFSDAEICDELKRRGFTGRIERVTTFEF